jgi:hypothetical protein
MDVNDVQVAGSHYKGHGRSDLQHWDVVHIFKLDYYQGNITKYVFRWREKGGVTDLHKALHYLQKYITLQGQEFNPFGEPAPAQQGIVHVGPAKEHFAVSKPSNDTVSWTGYHNSVKPTGWWGFTFEGADASGFMYQCDKCKVRFSIGQEDSPVFTHKCPEPDGDATSAYVNQDPA